MSAKQAIPKDLYPIHQTEVQISLYEQSRASADKLLEMRGGVSQEAENRVQHYRDKLLQTQAGRDHLLVSDYGGTGSFQYHKSHPESGLEGWAYVPDPISQTPRPQAPAAELQTHLSSEDHPPGLQGPQGAPGVPATAGEQVIPPSPPPPGAPNLPPPPMEPVTQGTGGGMTPSNNVNAQIGVSRNGQPTSRTTAGTHAVNAARVNLATAMAANDPYEASAAHGQLNQALVAAENAERARRLAQNIGGGYGPSRASQTKSTAQPQQKPAPVPQPQPAPQPEPAPTAMPKPIPQPPTPVSKPPGREPTAKEMADISRIHLLATKILPGFTDEQRRGPGMSDAPLHRSKEFFDRAAEYAVKTGLDPRIALYHLDLGAQTVGRTAPPPPPPPYTSTYKPETPAERAARYEQLQRDAEEEWRKIDAWRRNPHLYSAPGVRREPAPAPAPTPTPAGGTARSQQLEWKEFYAIMRQRNRLAGRRPTIHGGDIGRLYRKYQKGTFAGPTPDEIQRYRNRPKGSLLTFGMIALGGPAGILGAMARDIVTGETGSKTAGFAAGLATGQVIPAPGLLSNILGGGRGSTPGPRGNPGQPIDPGAPGIILKRPPIPGGPGGPLIP